MAEFDKFAGRYTNDLNRLLGAVGANADEFAAAKANWLVREAAQRLGPPPSLSVLDVGCGTGNVTQYLTRAFARTSGTDVSEGLLGEAGSRVPEASFVASTGTGLPFESNSMDVTFCACVMHHVSDADLPAFTAEMVRVTRPGGLVLTFEHNPANFVTRKTVRECELDKDVERLITPT